jgi:recombinational DNA repair protein (RecF pathway)
MFRGLEPCFVSHIITARCSICGTKSDHTHIPLKSPGAYCDRHCPAHHAMETALDHEAQALAADAGC